MTIQLTRQCEPSGSPGPSPACNADFTIDGQSGHQKLHPGGSVTLAAVHQDSQAVYQWEVISTPPDCQILLIRITPYSATLTLPRPGAYVVQLSVSREECHAQQRYILWAVTPRLLYCIPAANEPLRFDGKPEWAGDLARLMLEVDRDLPTDAQKAAMDAANHPDTENPFATMHDLNGGTPQPAGELTADEIAAIRAAEHPDADNRFVTDSDRRKYAPTLAEKAALDAAADPHEHNAFVTESRLAQVSPSAHQKEALDAAEDPHRCNPFVTESHLQKFAPTPDQRAALDCAEQPSGTNPFATESRVNRAELTPDQRAALNRAWAPSWENPLVTVSHLQPFVPTPAQRDALDHAHDPTADNPLVTVDHLHDFVPTSDQRAALDRSHEPDAVNPFVTQSHLETSVPTSDQRDALDRAQEPRWENPFVTVSHMHDHLLTPEQRKAIEHAENPSAANPVITASHLRKLAPSPEQKAAMDQAQEPSKDNPFVTRKMLPEDAAPIEWPIGLTPLQDDALDAAEAVAEPEHKPGTNNPFVTQSKLQQALPTGEKPTKWPIGLTSEQKAALDKADQPSESNPFATRKELNGLPSGVIGVTLPQKAALDHAHAPSATNPFITEQDVPFSDGQKQAIRAATDASSGNPFVTRRMLPDDPVPTKWPIAITDAQNQALDAAEAYGAAYPEHMPGSTNPFLAASRWEETAPTYHEKEAMDHANDPNAGNAFATLKDLDGLYPGSCNLDREHCDAVRNGLGIPSGANPFVTAGYLPAGIPPPEWPIGVTQNERDALDHADNPHASNPVVTHDQWDATAPTANEKQAMDRAHQPDGANPFATLADLGLAGITMRVVAAGNVNLGGTTTAPVLGGLKVVAAAPTTGLATLSFDGYKQNRQDRYIVKTLPVRQTASGPQHFTVVQFVEFTAQGFVLHMSQPLVPSTNLGRCMIEVSELIAALPPLADSLERAIRTYYDLIAHDRYGEAFEMLSKRYKTSHPYTIFESNAQESPIAGFDPAIRGYRAEVIVRLRRGGNILDAAAANKYGHRIVHLSDTGDPLDAPWKGKFDQDGNRPNFGVWHVVKPGDVRENNPDWYRCEIYDGEPPDWDHPGDPIAITEPFQLPHTANEQVITVELDHPAAKPLDLRHFIQAWKATGPAAIQDLQSMASAPGRPVYEVNLLYTNTNLTKRMRCEFERDTAAGHPRFDYWLFVDEGVLP